MVVFPPCKINLGLHVIARRPDGYHNLETCFYPVPWTDVLEIIPGESLQFVCTGLAVPGNSDENLCLRAYRLLQRDHDLPPVQIHLHKIIPTGAGLGGGSSDAAHTLRCLNDVFDLGLSTAQLLGYASSLGSDCAFFIHDGPMLGSGRGEVLADVAVSLKGKFLVIVKPDIHVSTAEAYAGVVPGAPAQSIKQTVEKFPLAQWKNFLENDFEKTILTKYPLIGSIKQKLYDQGAVYASMTGSGAAVFGIFEGAVNIQEAFPGAICWAGAV